MIARLRAILAARRANRAQVDRCGQPDCRTWAGPDELFCGPCRDRTPVVRRG